MDRAIVERLNAIAKNAGSFGNAVVDVAVELGIKIPDRLNKPSEIEITTVLNENDSAENFRLGISILIVRSLILPTHRTDNVEIACFHSVYERLCESHLLRGSDMQSYHTLMYILHRQPRSLSEYFKRYGG